MLNTVTLSFKEALSLYSSWECSFPCNSSQFQNNQKFIVIDLIDIFIIINKPDHLFTCVLCFFCYNMQLTIFAHFSVALICRYSLHIMDISFLSYIYTANIFLICISTLLMVLRYFFNSQLCPLFSLWFLIFVILINYNTIIKILTHVPF